MAATTTSTDAGSLIDPQSLMAIKSLEMRARVVVEGFWSGIHRSPYHGFSVEFTEYALTRLGTIFAIWTGNSLHGPTGSTSRNLRTRPICVASCCPMAASR